MVFISVVEWRTTSNAQDYDHKICFKRPSALSTLSEAVEVYCPEEPYKEDTNFDCHCNF